jgi:hypothetical protein
MAIIVLQPGDVLRLRVCCYDTASMQLGMNVLYYRITSIVGGLTYLEDAADAFQSFVSMTQLPALLASSASFVGCMVARIKPDDTRTNDFLSTADPVEGTSGDPLPDQTAGIWSFYRNRPGRMARGRNYIPFPSEDDNIPGFHVPSNAYLTNLTNYISAMSPTITVPVKTHSIVCEHVIHGKLTGEDPVIRSRARAKWGTQRRRGSYGAANVNPFA